MNPFMKTLKKIAAAYNGVSLILRIAIGLVVGVILALVCMIRWVLLFVLCFLTDESDSCKNAQRCQ